MMHLAVTNHTAAEIVYERADAEDRSYISDFDRFNSGNDDDTPLLPFDIDPKE